MRACTAPFSDDCGGWYDHEPPIIQSRPQDDYQCGFRVPLLVVSACTPPGYINNSRHDFGSILRFIEFNASIPQGLCISRIRAPRAI